MGAATIYVVASMVLLTMVTLGVAHFRLGVSTNACLAFVLPTIVVGSLAVAWVQTALALGIFAVPAGVGVVIFALAGFTVATS